MKKLELKDILNKPLGQFLIVGILIIVGFVIIKPGSHQKSVPAEASKVSMTKDIGISVGGVEQQAYIQRLEKNYYDFEDRVRSMEKQVKSIQSTEDHLNDSQKNIAQTILKLDQDLGFKLQQKLDEFRNSLIEAHPNADQNVADQEVELSIADIGPTPSEDWVYLPIGSFCKGTLLTGVYAAADVNNPLPVLISLDEAFYGPNKSRIPLKGSFVLGKAYGDLLSQRALIQIVAISSVLPSGHAFENEQDLGYVTDESGELGIRGQVIYNTGRQLALSFMGGFVAGGAQAMADAQVTSHKTTQGDVSKDVTGSSSKNMLFSGLAQSAGKLSEYYQKQAEEMVPAVHIKNGVKVCFIVQRGVTIKGLVRNNQVHRYLE